MFSLSVDSSHLEAVMHNPIPYGEPKFLRFVDDFEALADWLHARIEQDRFRMSNEMIPDEETQFTTEWQMASSVEEVPSP